jgi:Ca-activated chloride channel family protein
MYLGQRKPSQKNSSRTWHPKPRRAPAKTVAEHLKRQSRWVWHSLLIAVLFVQPAPAMSGEVSPGDMQRGSLLLRMQDGYRVSTLLNTEVNMQVNGLVARVSVRQEFRNEGNEWAEGVYVFPLPDKAAVDQMRLHIGDRFIEGEVREKEQARKEYEQAKKAGKKASLVEQERPNMFTTSVANIAPNELVVVEIEYLEDLRYDNGSFSIRFPLTITPRYIPGVADPASGKLAATHGDPVSPADSALPDREGSGWSPNTTSVADASLITPPMTPASRGHRVSMNVSVNAGVPLEIIASRYHPVNVSEQNNRYKVSLVGGTAPMDHDFELLWRPTSADAPRAMAFTETIAGEPHYLLMVMPPSAEAASANVMPREMIFIIDTSGSMHGTSIAQAKKALRRALKGLRPGDRFNVIAFSSSPNPLFPSSVVADQHNLSMAENFVATLSANGGTEMRAALDLALYVPPKETHLRQVIFITDGAVGNEHELFKLIERKLGNGRLFTVGIGSAPNSWFMRKSAEVGRGTFTTISALHEVGEKMDRLFSKIEQPQVTNIQVDWPSGVVADSYPAVVADLYLGEPVTVKARVTGPLRPNDVARISGDSAVGAWQQELKLQLKETSSGVAALWARARIADLMDGERGGKNADEVRAAVVETALKHHLVSKHTSLVAVDKTPARPVADSLRKDHVPNLMAYGQNTNAIFGFPATATNAQQMQLIGLGSILAAMLMMLLTRRRRETVHAMAR